jgi:hypothetical protein
MGNEKTKARPYISPSTPRFLRIKSQIKIQEDQQLICCKRIKNIQGRKEILL